MYVRISNPLASFDTCDKFSSKYQGFLAVVQTEIEPNRFSKAVKHSKWRVAMKDEINALKQNGIWTLTTLPPTMKALGYKWVYRIKLKSDGTVKRHKAKLIILGNT